MTMRAHALSGTGAENREEAMAYAAVSSTRRSLGPRDIVLGLGMSALALCLSTPLVAAESVLVPFPHDFAESITATSDGALIFSSFTGGRISRAAPGAKEASEWIKPGSNGLLSVLGVLADEASNTLYACSVDASGFGVVVPTGTKPGALKTFDLKTGAPKASYDVPAGTIADQMPLCNDMVVASDGTVYITDSLSSRILRLKKGASALEVWATDPRWAVKGPQLDGIAMLADGNLYANIFEGDGLYRIEIKSDGSAGAVTKLETSRKLYHSDGLRRFGPQSMIMVEGEKVGTLDLVTISGNSAKIETVQGGFDGPVSLVQVGDVAYVLDDPLRYLFDPELSKKPGPPVRAIPVKLPPAQ
jgi:sugar lactone lactonase YvrE